MADTNNRYVYYYAEGAGNEWHGHGDEPFYDTHTGEHCTRGPACKQFRKASRRRLLLGRALRCAAAAHARAGGPASKGGRRAARPRDRAGRRECRCCPAPRAAAPNPAASLAPPVLPQVDVNTLERCPETYTVTLQCQEGGGDPPRPQPPTGGSASASASAAASASATVVVLGGGPGSPPTSVPGGGTAGEHS